MLVGEWLVPNAGVQFMIIYHITQRQTFEIQGDTGIYRIDSLESEGFIHCSGNEADLLEVANHLYRSSENLIVLRIAADRLHAMVKWEPALGDPIAERLFPHIYGSINIDAVEGYCVLEMDEDGYYIGIQKT